MGMTWSPSLGTSFFLGSFRLVTFLCRWRGPRVKLRSRHCAQCYHCMGLLFSPKREDGKGQAELSMAGCLRSSHWPAQRANLVCAGALCGSGMSTTCSSSSLRHVWDLLTGSSVGHLPGKFHISCQQDFLWISFCRMAAPSPLHLGMIRFGALQVACEGSWAW